ncbi:putative dipeptidyl-aminopeptidase B, partial [Clarias magur]
EVRRHAAPHQLTTAWRRSLLSTHTGEDGSLKAKGNGGAEERSRTSWIRSFAATPRPQKSIAFLRSAVFFLFLCFAVVEPSRDASVCSGDV